jgi:Tol biopolymer transport system component
MVMNADGSNVRALLAPAVGASDELPDWSPDGRWIAFRSSRSGKHEIWRARVDGTGLMQITSTVLPQGLVRWRR